MSDDRPFPMLPIAAVAGAVIVTGVVAVVAIATSGSGSGRSATPTYISVDKQTINIRDFAFDPQSLSMPDNSSIVWSNYDAAPHNATARDGSWATKNLSKNEDDVLIFDTPGTWEYYCTIHPYMEGVLTVR